MTTADPIASYVSALERRLRGPRRSRRSMVAEARSGLWDAADAYREGGLDADQAAAWAVRDFGSVREVAPSFQDELTARQGRRSALIFALVFPAMLLGWDLLWSSGVVTRKRDPASDVMVVLARLQDLVAWGIGVAAATLLVVTFTRGVSPRVLTRAVGLTGVVGAALCGGTAIVMNAVGWHDWVSLVMVNPTPTVLAFGVSAVMLCLILWQSVRTLRVARAS